MLGEEFEKTFIDVVCRLLAAIYHLGCAGATPQQVTPKPSVFSAPPSPPRFINRSAAERAAYLLGCSSIEHLTDEVFATKDSQPTNNLELLGGFVANLYSIAVNTLKNLINK